ncbi:MAG: O-antigen ligase family protein [Oscillospiraceae bacterium]
MSCTENSVILQFIFLLWNAVRAFWHESAVGGWFHRRRLDLQRGIQTSAVCQFAIREGALVRGWPNSFICRFGTAFLNIPCAFAKWIYKKARGPLSGSLVFRGVATLGHGTWLLMGLFALVMLATPHAQWDNTYAPLAVAGIGALFLVGTANRQKLRLELDSLGPYMMIYMIFVCIGFVASLSVRLSMKFFLFHITSFFIVLLLVSAVQNYRQLHTTVSLAAAGITVASIYGCIQGIQGVAVQVAQQDQILNKDMPGRIYSFFDNPNNFAEILVMLIPLLMALFLNCKGWRGKLLSAAALVPCLISIGLTYSRSSWIGLALAVFIFLAFQNWRFIPGCLICGVLMLPFLPQSIINRILTIGNMEDTSTLYRFAIYEDVFRLLGDHGTTGVGLGHTVMGEVFKNYPTLHDGNYPVHAHSNYFQMWCELGIGGLIAYLALLLGQFKAGIKAFATTTSKEMKNMVTAAMAGLCGMLVISLAEYTWFYPRNMFLFWFLFAIIASCVKLGKKAQQAASF